MRAHFWVLALLLAPYHVQGTQAGANPIRRVVTMLQMMQKKVAAEGETEKELFEKYNCWCKTGASDLGKSIAAAEAKGPELESDIKEAESKKKQLEQDLESHKKDRAAAKTAMADATEIRQKEKAAFEKETADDRKNLDAVNRAVTAISKGMGNFLQTAAAANLMRVVQARSSLMEGDRQEVVAFLSGSTDYSPASGEIVGILKQMADEMAADLKEEVDAEKAAVKAYTELMAAKKKEVAALTASIEKKLERVGQLGVDIATMKNELGDTAEALEEDKKFLADLEENCKKKKAEYEANQKLRSEELVALADTIKILNDDDALDLFKKTLPSPASSFVQMTTTVAAMRTRALEMVQALRANRRSPALDFISLALSGKKIGFEKVIKMIDDLVVTLKQEQVDDDNKKEYCAKEFDSADDKKKELERSIAGTKTTIEDTKEGIETLTSEIAALEDGIKALDKAVAEATEQRKEENTDFKELMANDGAAKEVLAFAMNRLNKFYNPKLYKPPPKRELTEEERITVNMGGTLAPTAAPGGIAGTGISSLAQVAPPPPPETAAAFTKKGEESNGVIAMIKNLIKDLDKEMTEAKATEKNAQADYESFMEDSANKRTEDSKSLTDKGAAKAEAEAALGAAKEELTASTKELGGTLQYIQSLHAECDWLLQYFDVRKEARANEIDALGKAKAVLSGADYSLVQTASRHFLSRQ